MADGFVGPEDAFDVYGVVDSFPEVACLIVVIL